MLAALLLAACGRDATPIPPTLDEFAATREAPVVLDIPSSAPIEPPEASPVPQPKPKTNHSKPHTRVAPRPSFKAIPRAPLPLVEEPPYQEFCFVGICVAPPYRMEN